MSLFAVIRSNLKILFAFSLLIVGVIFQKEFMSIYNSYKVLDTVQTNDDDHHVRLFTEEQLANYDGDKKEKLYLALMGSVYDVTTGKQHYEKGASYHYFVGKDGSRVFVTGNFKDESADKDHVVDLKCDELSALLYWETAFNQKYQPVGLLIGRYYNDQGSPTEYASQVQQRLAKCKDEEEKAQREEEIYPSCNMEWSAATGSRVWCTNTSGGIPRSWSGVPRQLYRPGEDQPRCVCVDLTRDNSQALLREYSHCPATAVSCTVKLYNDRLFVS